VKTGEGVYAPRDIEIGQEAEGFYEVLSGLDEGDEVVTSANFLIDSESRLKAALR
jgi:Cu(I)/Ag(I) efflux system membrane fusion protein